MLETIYTITTIATGNKHIDSIGIDSIKIDSIRIAGWFTSFKKANASVISNGNGFDIYENYYNYAVIERVKSDVGSHVYKEWWFVWEKDDKLPDQGHYVPIEKPLFFTGTINFGIG